MPGYKKKPAGESQQAFLFCGPGACQAECVIGRHATPDMMSFLSDAFR